jgi:hypothetical protein
MEKTKKILLLLLFVVGFALFLIPGIANAQSTAAGCLQDPSPVVCKTLLKEVCSNPNDAAFTSQACVQYKLGVSQLGAGTFIVPRDPNSVFFIAGRIFLFVVGIATVIRGIIIAFKMGNAKPDERGDLIKQLVWTMVSMVLAFSIAGITFFVGDIFGIKLQDQLIKCDELPVTATAELKEKCKTITGVTPTIGTKTCINDQTNNVIRVPSNTSCPDGYF